MTEKEKELKSFNQCADALSVLDKRGILKVFHMLSIHFEVVDNLTSHSPAQDDLVSKNNDKEQNLLDALPPEQKTKIEKTKTAIKKSKSTAPKDPIYLTDFNFKPTDNKSLKDFYNEYTVKTNYENNLVFAYYFQEILKIGEISINHIYSCYRQLSIKVPSFPQTLKDTKTHKGWLDVSNTNDLKVTRTGINFIEHELAKKGDD
jgi:hypothetical protein